MLKTNISVLDKKLNRAYSAQMRADQNKVFIKKIHNLLYNDQSIKQNFFLNEPFILKMNISILDKKLNRTYSAQIRAELNKDLLKKI